MFKIQKLDLLVSIYIFCIAVSELMGAKTFPIIHYGNFTLNASVAIFVIPVIYTISDTIAEVYGKERAKSIVVSGIFIVFLLMIFSILAVYLPPSARFSPSQSAYAQVFGKSIRIAGASLVAFAIGEFLDILIFLKIKKKLGNKALWLRTNVANITSEFFDTTIFISLAFYALNKPFGDNFSFLFSLILPYWILKCLMSVGETPFVYMGVKWLKDLPDQNKIEIKGNK